MTQVTESRQRPSAESGRGQALPARRWLNRLVPVMLILVGVLVTLYPVAATYYNNYRQAVFAASHNQDVQQADPAHVAAALEAAHTYNSQLQPGLLMDPWSGGEVEGGADYEQYLAQLSDFQTMARLRIPEISVDEPVYHGTSEATLSRGVGHMYGTSLPVGGPGTHSVLTAHSGMTNATHFDRLHELESGDIFYIDVYGETLAYQVDSTSVVLPDDLSSLPPTEGVDAVTLITCTPYGINSHRLLVHAVRIPCDPTIDHTTNPLLSMDWSIQPWMWTRIGLSLAALILIGAMFTGWIRDDRRQRKDLR